MADLKAFHEHVKRGDLDVVQSALAEDASLLNATNESGQSAFLLAKYYRQQKTADYLLSLEPRLDIFDACVAGRVRSVLSEIDRDAALLDARSADGWTPLHLAAFFGHAELANELLNRGAQVDARSTNPMKNTPLHAAAAGGSAVLVELLLKRNADANARQEGGFTALHAAAQSGNRQMIEALLAHGADLNARAGNRQTPLDLALGRGHQEIVTLLEQLGAELH